MVKLTVKPTRRRSIGSDADHTNRESYLMDAVEIIRPLFLEHGAEIPPFHVSVGWPGGRGGLKILGRCWKREASRDGAFQIFVSPVIDDTIQALGILVHELCHACTDCEGHNHEFKALARGIGLDGKLTATFPSDILTDRLNGLVVEKLGKYPHSALTPEKSGEKKQGTRLIKCVCDETGYTIRTTRNWLASYGAPISPKTKQPMRIIENAETPEAPEDITEEAKKS